MANVLIVVGSVVVVGLIYALGVYCGMQYGRVEERSKHRRLCYVPEEPANYELEEVTA